MKGLIEPDLLLIAVLYHKTRVKKAMKPLQTPPTIKYFEASYGFHRPTA